jgi:ubiquinone/menaquinone biosynthesis C-methylase UbiE
VDDPIAVIKEFQRVLRANGLFLVSVWHNCCAENPNKWDETWQRVHSAYQMQCVEVTFVHVDLDQLGNGWHQGIYRK